MTNSTPENTSPIEDLLRVMERLRDPSGGCPWDLEQDYRSIVPHTLEEAYEVADAIERDDFAALKDELGDLLFQVLFYAQLAREEGRFDFDTIVSGLAEKLIRRHPHVFADSERRSIQDVSATWEALKAEEREQKAEAEERSASVLDDVPINLPALSRAAKLQKRASRVGFDWDDIKGPLAKIREETEELHDALNETDERVEHELGDLLFSVVNAARFRKIDPEKALRYANQRFAARFGWIEQQIASTGKTMEDASEEELDALWNRAKQALSVDG